MTAIDAIGMTNAATHVLREPSPEVSSLGGAAFSDYLRVGVANVDAKVAEADGLMRQFILDGDSVPIHQVTLAMAEAQYAVDLAMQVRARLMEGYRDLMNMQL